MSLLLNFNCIFYFRHSFAIFMLFVAILSVLCCCFKARSQGLYIIVRIILSAKFCMLGSIESS